MAVSLGFHIIFAAVGMAMPLLMTIAEGFYLRTGEAVYLELAKRWAKGTAILFAVGTASGPVLLFEPGLLWPTFMRYSGPVIGMPFSLEALAFFLEAIFQLFKQLAAKGLAIIITTHNQAFGYEADRVITLEDGKIVNEERPRGVKDYA